MEKLISSLEAENAVNICRQRGMSIGFVPTMGALHQGHAALIKRAKEENEFVICSIFVNPIQFNNPSDFEKYPIRLEEDFAILKSLHCDAVFLPTKEDIYPEEPFTDYDFGSLTKEMEGKFRPGHFEGVAAVIERFFKILNPDKAYFGDKDFQQVAVVQWLVKKHQFATKIIPCETERFENGLAMSSRNFLLSDEDRETASEIYQWMMHCKNEVGKTSPVDLMQNAKTFFSESIALEYATIVDQESLELIQNWSESNKPRAFVAAYLSGVRLIDNLALY